MSSANRLEMQAISKSFNKFVALADGRLSLQAGEVHALMGANGAGKSTLMNILGGVIAKDSGTIMIDGVPTEIENARHAADLGIAFVHQELTTMPTLTVGENIYLGDYPTRGPLIAKRKMNERAAELLARVGCQVSPKAIVEDLSTGDRQLVEIARAIRKSPRIIIFDEPTSSLSGPERKRLFAVIEKLRSEGVGIIFISHFLDEVFLVSDRITVMRNGKWVGTWRKEETTASEVVNEMLGSVAASERVREPVPSPERPFIKVSTLSSGTLVDNVSFSIGRGEIVGLWGLLGSGRTELVRALMGLDPLSSGSIEIADAGGILRRIAPRDLRRRTGLVTEDRRKEGLILPFDISGNVGLPNYGRLAGPFGLIDSRKEKALAETIVKDLGVKASSISQIAGTLSGGNQQKIVFGKWLPLNPDFFILDEPTRGLDTGAKSEILKLTVKLASEGASVLFISSELEELMRVADRYLVVSRGTVTRQLDGHADHDALMAAVSDIPQAQELRA